ncbi:MAG: glycerol-3-phosphate 1-O-acyltransferase [Solirubrobacteraceae bacterium]|nr:glycerol-3-phosphate 1-O-acyltransferase [Solirubrobacteraceae bacterium]
MTTTREGEHEIPMNGTGRPPSVLVLADARTRTEREALEAWASRERPGAAVATIGDPGITPQLADPDRLVEPVRVTWLPSSGRTRDLGTLLDPRRPSDRIQRLAVARNADRLRVTVGEPATARELDERFHSEEGGGSPERRAAFVARQAQLACDRAERQVLGDRYKVPRHVAEQIAASASFHEDVARIADEIDMPFPDALEGATAGLHELVAAQSPLAIDAFRAFVRPMHARAWTVEYDHADIERLRARNREHALVFLPTHRSYVDPLVLGELLHNADMPRNHLLGGDNMSFWPLGPLGKRSGVIFIRRKFGGDRLYRLAIKAYFSYLVAKRFNLEWYIEGGRTRTGKLRPPRYGLLHYLTEAVADGDRDVLLVPTSILYDRLHEVSAMVAEQRGAQKRGEGLRWWVDYVRAQSRNVGTARVEFGEPFSLRDALEDAGPGRAQLEKVAFRICTGINEVTPVRGTSVVSFVLLGLRDRALTLDEVVALTTPLLDVLEERGARGDLERLRRPSTLRGALDALVDADAVTRFDGGDEPVWSIAPDGHGVAAFYRNGALHHLIMRAIVELVVVGLTRSPEAPGPERLERAWQDALALRDLLKFEFFFHDKARFRQELREETDRFSAGWQERMGTQAEAGELLSQQRMLVAHRTLRSFFDAQLVVARRLVALDPREAASREELLTTCLGTGQQAVLRGEVHGAESVSRELFAAALDLAANRDLVDPGREPVHAARRAWLDELEEVIGRLRVIEALDRAALAEVLDGDDR